MTQQKIIDKQAREIAELRDWISRAAPMLDRACCLLVDCNQTLPSEIMGCRALLESCPDLPNEDS